MTEPASETAEIVWTIVLGLVIIVSMLCTFGISRHYRQPEAQPSTNDPNVDVDEELARMKAKDLAGD